MRKFSSIFIWLTLVFSACTTQNIPIATGTIPPTRTSAPTFTPSPTETPTMTPTATPATFTRNQLAGMSLEDKLVAAPENPDGYTKSNVSTVSGMEHLVAYRDGSGTLSAYYDLRSGGWIVPAEVGLTELDLNDGGKFELRVFYDHEAALDFIYAHSLIQTGDRFNFMDNVLKTEDARDLVVKLRKLEGWRPVQEFVDNWDTEEFKWIHEDRLSGGLTLYTYLNEDGKFETVLLSPNDGPGESSEVDAGS